MFDSCGFVAPIAGYQIIQNGAHKILVTPVWQWAVTLP